MNDERRDNVIHVAFGKASPRRSGTDAARVRGSEPTMDRSPRASADARGLPAPSPEAEGVPRAPERATMQRAAANVRADAEAGRSPSMPPPRVEDAMSDLYEAAEVARFFGVTERRLRAWQKRDLVVPSVVRGRRVFYTFRDLVSLRTVKGLLDSGVPTRAIEKAVASLRAMLPRSSKPLNELRVIADGGSVVVVDEQGSFEPATGQQVLDFTVEGLRADVVRVMRRPLDAEARRTAYDHYLEGCRFDEDPATMERAAEAYLAALRLDPALSSAITNLGNLRFRQGRADEAERLYRSALAIDDEQPEAHYNLGFLALERDDADAAVPRLERAVALDPAFADAHYNLATALESLGLVDRAREHFRAYLELEPEGAWSDYARARLAVAR